MVRFARVCVCLGFIFGGKSCVFVFASLWFAFDFLWWVCCSGWIGCYVVWGALVFSVIVGVDFVFLREVTDFLEFGTRFEIFSDLRFKETVRLSA